MTSRAGLPTIAFLHECFVPDFEMGTLTWKTRPASHYGGDQGRANNSNSRWAGKVAGGLDTMGYISIGLKHDGCAKHHRVHRVIWAMFYGEWPRLHIDHINQIRTENSITNLRDVTQRVNNNNTPRFRGDLAGTEIHRNGKRFRGYIYIGTKRRHLGMFDTAAEAHEAHLRAHAELFGGRP